MSKGVDNLETNNEHNAQMLVQKAELFSGPVPHPEIIERYEKIYPGAAKIIFEEWDSQVKHRQSIEQSVIKTDNIKSILGVTFGFIIVIATLISGVYTVNKGAPLFGGSLSFAGLAILVAAFISNRRTKNKK